MNVKYFAQPLWELTSSEFENVEVINVNTATDWRWDEEANVIIVQPVGYTLTNKDYERIDEVMHS